MRLAAVLLVTAVLLAGCAAGTQDPAVAPAPSEPSEQAPAVAPVPPEPTPPVTARATQQSGARAKFRLVRVARGFDSPVHLAAAPGEPNRLYVVEQAGRIRAIQNGRVQSNAFLDIRNLVTSGGEQGLLSVAFHPDYAANRLFYVDYTDEDGHTRVVEYRARANGQPVESRQILFVEQPDVNHNGGQLAFGPDGYLYVGMGDGGGADNVYETAQDLSSRLGKLLRIDVDAAGSDWEIVAYGLRNPWRFSFDRKTGDLYMGDVGQDEWEEIDYARRNSPGLENYGWPRFEGKHQYLDEDLNSSGRVVGPIAEYNHDLGCSVTGGFVYRGSAVPKAKGRYFYGDYCTGTVWSFVVVNGKATDRRRHSFSVAGLSSFGENLKGELYLVSQGGAIYRLAKG
jgi:glucose/arabinose dehydrogenase